MSNSPDSGTKERPVCPPPAADNAERLRDRIKRHVIEVVSGNIDPQALVRGGQQIVDKLTLARETDGYLELKEHTQGFAQIPGLDFSAYAFLVPIGPAHIPTSLELTTFRPVNIRILDFPPDSRLVASVTPLGQKPIHTASFINRVPGAIATVTGPTFTPGDDLPNNGFYFQSTGDTRPFMDTNPPGERRGAFGITEDEQLQLIDDSQKWAVVNSGFNGYRLLAGTSHYILGSDNAQNYPNLAQVHKNCLSFLMQSEQPDGKIRFSFIRNERMLSRDRLRRVMQTHAEHFKLRMMIAVELEYGKASCVVNTPSGRVEYGTGFNDRRDHYVFVRN